MAQDREALSPPGWRGRRFGFKNEDRRTEASLSVNDEHQEVQIGYLPLSALYGRSSHCAEAAKLRQIREELAMTMEQRSKI
jgi:hypothetical protein